MMTDDEMDSMASTATTEDPFTQYLLGASLVILIIGSVGGLAQYLHWNELPSLAYTATILVPVVGLVLLAGLYQRYLSHRILGPSASDDSSVPDDESVYSSERGEVLESEAVNEAGAPGPDEAAESSESVAEVEDVIETPTEKN